MKHTVTFRGKVIMVYHIDTKFKLPYTVEFYPHISECRFIQEDTLILASWLIDCHENKGYNIVL